MKRREFLTKSLQAGICGCAAASALLSHGAAGAKVPVAADEAGDWIDGLERRMIEGSESPDWRRLEKSLSWICDMLDNMDTMLDDETKLSLLRANGRACYLKAFGVASDRKPGPDFAARFLQSILLGGGEVTRDGDRTVVLFSWGRKHQNPQGLILSDGYCMCPIFESEKPEVSATFCQCSAGYVGELFQRYTGKRIERLEVVDSLKMGGKDCIFRIEMLDA